MQASATDQRRGFDLFPDELILQIASSLQPLDIARFSQVCRRINQVTHDPNIWSNVYEGIALPLPPKYTILLPEIKETVIRAHKIDRYLSGALVHTIRPKHIDLSEGLTVLPRAKTACLVWGRYLILVYDALICCYDLDHMGSGKWKCLYKHPIDPPRKVRNNTLNVRYEPGCEDENGWVYLPISTEETMLLYRFAIPHINSLGSCIELATEIKEARHLHATNITRDYIMLATHYRSDFRLYSVVTNEIYELQQDETVFYDTFNITPYHVIAKTRRNIVDAFLLPHLTLGPAPRILPRSHRGALTRDLSDIEIIECSPPDSNRMTLLAMENVMYAGASEGYESSALVLIEMTLGFDGSIEFSEPLTSLALSSSGVDITTTPLAHQLANIYTISRRVMTPLCKVYRLEGVDEGGGDSGSEGGGRTWKLTLRKEILLSFLWDDALNFYCDGLRGRLCWIGNNSKIFLHDLV